MAKDKAKTDETKAPKCKISRDQFNKEAPRFLTLTISDDKGNPLGTLTAGMKNFESGSVGYYVGDKITLVIAGEACKLQAGVNLTLVGSKELPK